MAPPTTTDFDLFDWDGGVKISDPTDGLAVQSEGELSHGPPNIGTYLDIIVHDASDALNPGDVLIEDPGTSWSWQVVATEIVGNDYVVRVSHVSGPVPTTGQSFDTGTVTGVVGEVTGVLAHRTTGETLRAGVGSLFPERTTLQFRLVHRSLPDDHDDTSNYFFLGIVDGSGLGTGLRFSSEGISLLVGQDYKSESVPLAGSSGLVPEDVDLTYRLVLDGEENKALIYATETSQIELVGHVLRYEAPYTPMPAPDKMLATSSSTGPTISYDLLSFRASSTALVPNARPVSVTGDDQESQLGDLVNLDGTGSYDPEEEQLTYRWLIRSKPDGSTITLQDPVVASYTLLWSDATLAISSKTPGQDDNGILVDFDPAVSFSITYSSTNRLIRVRYVPGTTTILDLITAWVIDPDVMDLFDIAATGNTGNYLFPAGGSLTGGAAGTGPFNYFKPDKLGFYRVGLVVNDGQLDSYEVETLVNVIESTFEMGYVPDGNVVWKYLPDFWNLVKGKEPFATLFSSYVQVITAELARAWQVDHGKALDTIQRQLQRRWMHYSPLLEEDTTFVCGEMTYPTTYGYGYPEPPLSPSGRTTNMIVLEEADPEQALFTYEPGDSMVVWPSWGDPSLLTVSKIQPIKHTGEATIEANGPRIMTDSKANFIAAGVAVGDIVQITGGSPAVEGRGRVLAVQPNALTLAGPALSAPEQIDYKIGGVIHFEESEVEFEQLIDEGFNNGRKDPSFTDRLILLGPGEFDLLIDPGDKLRLFSPRTGEVISEYDVASSTSSYVRVVGTLEDVYGVSWEVIKERTDDEVLAMAYPVFSFDEADEDDVPYLVSADDSVKIEATYGDDTYEWMGHVVATRGRRFAVTPNKNVIDGLLQLVEIDKVIDPSTMPDSVSVTEVWRLSRILVPEEVTSIPRLQESPGDPSDPLLFSRDYQIEEDEDQKFIQWVKITEGQVDDIEAGLPLVTVSGVDLIEAGVTVGSTIVIPVSSAVGNPFYPFGTAQVVEILDEESMVINWATTPENSNWKSEYLDPLSDLNVRRRAGTVIIREFYIQVYGAYNLPSRDLWAEVTYYDNAEQIEDNFGLAVGLTEEMLESDLELDYLSAVKALWFAFWTGPTLANARLGAQIFFNLPFSEREGTIIAIDANHTPDTGRIVIQSDDGTVRSYFYPTGLGVDTNPDTETEYVVGDWVEIYRPLCKGIEVIDYVKDPTWMRGALEGPHELRKYHTFKVEVDLDGLGAAPDEAFASTLDFILKIKPRHTNVILLGFHETSDTIDVDDNVVLTVKYPFKDETYLFQDPVTDDSPTNLTWGTELATGERLRTGFLHKLDDRDGEFNIPHQQFRNFFDKARSKFWLVGDEDKGTFNIGDIVFGGSPEYAFQVIHDGPSYLLVTGMPWVMDVSPALGFGLGAEVYEDSSDPQWYGTVYQESGSSYIAVDHLRSIRKPVVGDDVTDGVGPPVTLTAATQRHWYPPSPTDTLRDAGGSNVMTILSVVEWLDYISHLDRKDEVGPEVFNDSRCCFYVGGSKAYTLDCSPLSGISGTDIIHETTSPPNWWAKCLRVSGSDVFIELPPVVRLSGASPPTGIAPSDIIYTADPATTGRWACRVLHVDGTDIYVEPTSSQPLPSTPVDFIGKPGAAFTATSVTSISNGTPVATETFVNQLSGSGTITTAALTVGRYPQLGLGLTLGDIEVFSGPVDQTYSALVEVADSTGFVPGEEVRFPGFPNWRARVRATGGAGGYWLSLYGLNIPTLVVPPGQPITGNISSSATTTIRTWDPNEYSVPSMGPGRYFWMGEKLVDDYLLRIHYTGTGPTGADTELTKTPADNRWKGLIQSFTGSYVDVRPGPGFLRSQPVRGDVLVGNNSSNTMTVRPESWALQWIPNGSPIDDEALCRIQVLDPTPYPKPPRKASTKFGDTVIVDAIGV